MSDSPRMNLLLGAGISAAAPARIPLWNEIAHDTMQFLYRTLEHRIRATGGDGYLLAKQALDIIEHEVYPETVLECLSRAYGRTDVVRALHLLLDPPDCEPNACHRAIAQLCEQGRVGVVVTTNFDVLLERALDQLGLTYSVITDRNVADAGILPLIKVHGTVADASSLIFTRNEYYLGLPSSVREALRSYLAGCALVIAGYSGNDIDMFPFVRSMIEGKMFEQVHVVDPVALEDNKRFAGLGDYVEYHQESAEEFFCRLAGTSLPASSPPRERRVSAIAPSEDKFPAALFFADCLLHLGLDAGLAFSLLFLTQDIVEEETGDLRQLCISLLAKSHALFDSADSDSGESEYSAGRTLLHRLLDNSDLPNQKDMLSEFGSSLAALEIDAGVRRSASTSGFMSGRSMPRGPDRFDDSPRGLGLLHSVLYWELRTRIRVCFSAMAFAASNPSSEQQRLDMLAVPDQLMYGFQKWQKYFADKGNADELPFIPLFYSKYFAAYRSLLTHLGDATQSLDECLRISKQAGFFLGSSHCYFLKDLYGLGLSEAERTDYVSIQDYCGVDVQRTIAPLYRPGRQAFSLSVATYTPPLRDAGDAAI